MQDLAKLLIISGAVILLAGVVLFFAGRIPFLGRLPGDITYSSGGFTCYFPLATMILLSILLTLLLQVFNWLSRRGP